LLIANPGESGEENYCKGVYVDIGNYVRVLTSPEGGAWVSSEIKYLNRPSATEVRDWLVASSFCDYVFVMFTGHGWYSRAAGDRILELRSGERIGSVELVRGAKKRTVILDCCQRVHPEALLENMARNIIRAKEAGGRRTADWTACRNLFDESVENAPQGIITAKSCSIDEIAEDDDERGGRYNGSLIACVDDWVRTQADEQFSRSSAMASIVAFHECAAEKTRQLSENSQNPRIEKPRTGPYFPMAVFG
jgi:hypothetical protein